MKMTFFSILACLALGFSACSSSEGKKIDGMDLDSLEKEEMERTPDLIKNDDSLVKAKEKELLEQYGN